jgi:hypothetical protein
MEYGKELVSITSKGFWRLRLLCEKKGVVYGALVRWSYMSWKAALVFAVGVLRRGSLCNCSLENIDRDDQFCVSQRCNQDSFLPSQLFT